MIKKLKSLISINKIQGISQRNFNRKTNKLTFSRKLTKNHQPKQWKSLEKKTLREMWLHKNAKMRKLFNKPNKPLNNYQTILNNKRRLNSHLSHKLCNRSKSNKQK